jgi:outer membrane lipoprotein
MRTLLFIVLGGLTLAGCAPVLSKASLDLVDTTISYQQLKDQPEQYVGRYVVLGGIIAGVRNSRDGGALEIVQFGLDARSKPREDMTSAGRFLATSSEFLDPLVFRPGRSVSLVGQVAGEKPMELDGISYHYPVVTIKELRLLPPEKESAFPMFHFGIGIGHTF